MTESFSRRHGLRRTPPPRTRLEEAPQDLRSVLLEILVEGRGHLWAYRELCRVLHRTPDSNIWSDQGAREAVYQLIDELEWFEVFDLLEAQAGRHGVEKVNDSFVRTGLAYEMVDDYISLYDPEGDELEVAGDEDLATKVLTGKLAPVATQYSRALAALRGRPADPEKAIGEALGALEAVARILGGKQDFGPNVDKLLGQGQPWRGALGASLKSLYGYGSQVPGARHGRYADPVLAIEEATMVVRMCGAGIAYLAALDRLGQIP